MLSWTLSVIDVLQARSQSDYTGPWGRHPARETARRRSLPRTARSLKKVAGNRSAIRTRDEALETCYTGTTSVEDRKAAETDPSVVSYLEVERGADHSPAHSSPVYFGPKAMNLRWVAPVQATQPLVHPQLTNSSRSKPNVTLNRCEMPC